MATPKRPEILAVDDLPDNLFLLEVILEEQENYHLSCVDNGKAAIERVEKSPPDLILLDLMMPDIDGCEVTRRIRQNPDLPYIPILLLTAHDETSANQGLSVGADSFIRKPFDVSILLKRMQRLLQQNCEHVTQDHSRVGSLS